jgi:hypothetical protein
MIIPPLMICSIPVAMCGDDADRFHFRNIIFANAHCV